MAPILPAAGIFAAGKKESLAGQVVGAEPSTRVDVFVNMGIIHRLREMLDVMCSDICDRNQDL